MFRISAIFGLLVVFSTGSPVPQNADVYSDPICPGNIKNLWMDVVVVVDKSQLMTNAQLWQVRTTISQVFGSVGTIGPTKYPADKRSTCVGIVTYDANATTNAEVDQFTNFSDLYNSIQTSLVSVDSTNSSFLSNGLLAAEKAFADSRRRTIRYNFQQVVIVFASAFQGAHTVLDPIPVARRLKNNGVTIITVACTTNQNDIGQINGLASPGYDFIDEMNTAKLVKQLTNALLSVNCFCPSDWVQLRNDYKSPFSKNSTQYGICVNGYKATGGSYGYQHAIDWCEYQEKNAFLANEFSQLKHDFNQYVMTQQFSWEFSINEYYIGLRFYDNQWLWEQPTGQPRIPLNPSVYSNWAPGYPQANSTGQVISNQPWTNGSTTVVWAPPQTNDWMFICQVQAASTEYYAEY